MKCPECGLEMLFYGATKNEKGEKVSQEFVCANKKCGRFDARLKKKTATTAAEEKQE